MAFTYRGDSNITINSISDVIEFQISDWSSQDEKILTNESDESDDEYVENTNNEQIIYKTRIYGVTEQGYSVCAHVDNFKPYFYVRVEKSWDIVELNIFKEQLKTIMWSQYKQDIIKVSYIKKKDFFYFTNGKKFKFIKIKFNNFSAYKCVKYTLMAIENPSDANKPYSNFNKRTKFERKLTTITGKGFTFNDRMYECNFDPFLRLMHIRNIQASDWIQINNYNYHVNEPKLTTCQIDITVDYENINPIKKDILAPLYVLSFDIESYSVDGSFPNPKRETDAVIQIGSTVRRIGETECCFKHIVTLKQCNPIDGVEVECYDDERELLIGWATFVKRLDPDIITGYNIWGFDWQFIYERAQMFNVEFMYDKLGRYIDSTYDDKDSDKRSKFVLKELSSSAMGSNFLKYIDMEGRVQIDLYKFIMREHTLSSYKLNDVSAHFMNQNKCDLSPKELFENYRIGTADKITEIAVYCIQDCELCNNLLDKLSVVPNNIGMSNVSSIPLQWIFLRGQGIKIYSLVLKQCRSEDYLIKTVRKDESDNLGYEGAIVLKPKIGMYLNTPVSVLDFASLYPSSMIAENISHETLVNDPKYDNLPGYNYNEIKYDIYEGTGADKHVVGKCIRRYAEPITTNVDDCLQKKGMLPRILMYLLSQRKATRKKIPGEPDPFKKQILEGLQLSYKLTANSLYGQTGSWVSQIYLDGLAPSTTAVGRQQLIYARNKILSNYAGSDCIYGDTDSVFLTFDLNNTVRGKQIRNTDNRELTDKEKLEIAWEVGCEAGELVTQGLKQPNDLEMEKNLYPLVLFSKKRYIGNLYEANPEKFKQKSMGIVLKRRDSANIVKHIYGGIMDIILNEKNLEKAKQFYINCIEQLLNGDFDLESFRITKKLSAIYKSPQTMPHWVLAMRIGDRTGEYPQSNDRIPFCFIDTKCLKCKVCDKRVNELNCKCIGCCQIYCNEHLVPLKHKPCNLKCRICCVKLQDIPYKNSPTNCCDTECNAKIPNINNGKMCWCCNKWYCNRNKKCYSKHKCVISGKPRNKYECTGCKGWFCSKHLDPHVHDAYSKNRPCTKITTKILQGDRVEDPEYIKDNNLKIDYMYYLDHQLREPINQIFKLCMDNPNQLIKHLEINYNNNRNGVKPITSFFTIN
jgi:DNA polymerase delta subunit 1